MNAVDCSASSLDTISSSSNTMETGPNKAYGRQARECRSGFLLTLTLLSVLASPVKAWGSNGNSNTATDESAYGNIFTQSWLYDSVSLSLKVEGCIWGNVDDSEDVGCLEDESEDGTVNWYMMANCRRPQVAFSVYGSSSESSSCNSNNLKGSYVTSNGLSSFMSDLETYDSSYDYEDDGTELTVCADTGDGYIGLDCAEDGSFAINYFNDQYCLSRTGNAYNGLSNVNSMFSNHYQQCIGAYSYDGSDDYSYSLVHQLVYYSEPCTSLDSDLCENGQAFEDRSESSGTSTRQSSSTNSWSSNMFNGSRKSWVTKLKYVVGGMFLLASFIMFTGILFTNRRRRRAMMMRKYRQSKKDKSRSGESRKARSASKSKRSKSRDKSRDKVRDGVFT
jgi:hypothetical protein